MKKIPGEVNCSKCGKSIRLIWGPPQPQEFTDKLKKEGVEFQLMGCLVPSEKEFKEMEKTFICSKCRTKK